MAAVKEQKVTTLPTSRPSIVSTHPGARIILWSPDVVAKDGSKSGHRWTPIKNTQEELEKAIAAGAMFVTNCACDKTPSLAPEEKQDPINRAPLRFGKLNFDLDGGDLSLVLRDTRELVKRLLEKGLTKDQIELHFSGKKGFHVSVEPRYICEEAYNGDRFLYLIYKEMAKELAAGVASADLSIYCSGYGKQYRIPNVRRTNGKHKIPINHLEIDEAFGLAPEEFLLLAEQPRELPPAAPGGDAPLDMRRLYAKCRRKAHAYIMRVSEEPKLKTEQRATLASSLPACLTKILNAEDYDDLGEVNFNKLCYSVLVPYYKREAKKGLEEAVEELAEFFNEFSGSATYPSRQEREGHFRDMWQQSSYEWKCEIARAEAKCDCSGCPVQKLSIEEMFGDEETPVGEKSFLETLSAKRFLESPPLPTKWLLKESLPAGMVGLVAGKGGTCKTFLLMQMEMEIAGIVKSMDGIWETEETGAVFAIHAEDPDNVLHQRSLDIATGFTPFDYDAEDAFLGDVKKWDNWYCASGVGKSWSLTDLVDGKLAPSAKYLKLLRLLKTVPNLKLIVLDPLSRFDQLPGKNDVNTQATFFITLMERLALETGAAVLVACHTNKASAATPDKSALGSLTQESVMGAAQYVNSSRWTLALTALNKPDLQGIGQKGNPSEYVAGKVVKKNNGKPEEIFYVKRGHGGVLRRLDTSKLDTKKLDAVSTAKKLVLDLVTKLDAEGRYKTKRDIAREYHATWKESHPAIKRAVVESAVAELLDDGFLTEIEINNAKGRPTTYVALGDKINDELNP